ncbi:hypothetical protein [Bradyrhizobium sp. CCGB20]|uniref:hypothetical protein n=1 Tax=Bradyrhizobium sp. CCGB20 TaxID=2949633 RepID=UPI0020B3E19A|nr:hypothetical protein [Bradyrhizobium sp. CCGB20]MCP3396224.1 hypothetical protein [Bradyrhizobium sp. CCGB20]
MKGTADMNFRRGFFRLWALGSILFVLGVAAFSYDDVAAEFKRDKAAREWNEIGLMLLPVHCKDARGKSGTDYTGRDGPWADYSAEGQCMYKMGDFRRLYPEYKDLSDNDLVDRIYKQANRPIKDTPQPWWFLGQAVAMAVIVPLIVFLFGWAIAWALAGFRRKEA